MDRKSQSDEEPRIGTVRTRPSRCLPAVLESMEPRALRLRCAAAFPTNEVVALYEGSPSSRRLAKVARVRRDGLTTHPRTGKPCSAYLLDLVPQDARSQGFGALLTWGGPVSLRRLAILALSLGTGAVAIYGLVVALVLTRVVR